MKRKITKSAYKIDVKNSNALKDEEIKTKLALRFYPEVQPDVDIPSSYNEGIKNGWLYNECSMRVEKACTSSTTHSCWGWDKTTTQNPRKLYSTEKKAYEALLCAMAKKFALEMRSVERRMENCDIPN